VQECSQDKAAFMRVMLTKVVTTMEERTMARVQQADFGLPDGLWQTPRDVERLPLESLVPEHEIG
jgi:hypothetical protein